MKSILLTLIIMTFTQLSLAEANKPEPIYNFDFIEVSSFYTEPICPKDTYCKRDGTIVHLAYE